MMKFICVLLAICFSAPVYAGGLQDAHRRVIARLINAGATEVFNDGNGFESPWAPTSNAGNWDSFNGTPTSEGTTVKNGTVSMRCGASSTYMIYDFSDYTEIWVDFWVYFDSSDYIQHVCEIVDSGASNKVSIKKTSGDSIVIYDETTTWDSTVDSVDDTWYHIFLHLIYTTGGSETVQIAINESASWDSWDYSSTSATIVPTNASYLRYGTPYMGGADSVVLDTLRLYQGSGMPSSW